MGDGRAWQPGPVPPPQPGAGQLGDTGAAAALSIGHFPEDSVRRGWARTWARRWARLSRAHGWAGQGCGELETGPAVVSLGQGLVVLGADMGSWATGRVGGAAGTEQGQSELLKPSGPWTFIFYLFVMRFNFSLFKELCLR